MRRPLSLVLLASWPALLGACDDTSSGSDKGVVDAPASAESAGLEPSRAERPSSDWARSDGPIDGHVPDAAAPDQRSLDVAKPPEAKPPEAKPPEAKVPDGPVTPCVAWTAWTCTVGGGTSDAGATQMCQADCDIWGTRCYRPPSSSFIYCYYRHGTTTSFCYMQNVVAPTCVLCKSAFLNCFKPVP